MSERNDVDTETLHQIGEVADAVGLSLRTIRHYEEVGLVEPSERSSGGFRLYTDADIERLRLVRHMKPLEFTLDEMRQLLEVRDALETADPSAETDLRGRLAMFAAAAEERCERLRAALHQAEEFAGLLRSEAQPPRQPGARRARS
ncbi:MAG: MerR family transcriptional regulator [Acidimicrobiia bacterium]|nr:MerR family transcriptional regulator [Acidimicrobiia bacterium]